jgi:YcxB-like protein
MDDVVVEYIWTRDEWIKGVRRSARVTIYQALWVLIIAVISIFVHIFVFALALGVVLWILLWILGPIFSWKRVAGIQESRRVVFADNGITTTTSSKTWTVPWSTFSRSKETADYYLLFGKRPAASPFKKSIFPCPVDEARFRSLLRSHTRASLNPNTRADDLK